MAGEAEKSLRKSELWKNRRSKELDREGTTSSSTVGINDLVINDLV